MQNLEQLLGEFVTPTPAGDQHAPVDDVTIEPRTPITVLETPTGPAARVLEVAAVTADRLVSDAEMEAESLVTTAQAKADAIVQAGRDEADQVAAQLNRDRATAMTHLAEEKAAVEARIAVLRQMESDHFNQMRHHLTEQLSLLDATLPEPPAAVTG
jgi:cell division septum initiation protein DivIVA